VLLFIDIIILDVLEFGYSPIKGKLSLFHMNVLFFET